MQRRLRLTDDQDFRQTRQKGRSWATPFVVLYARPNGLDRSRVGFSVGKRLGKATVRNRVKRRLREAIRLDAERLAPGWDVVLIARGTAVEATFDQLREVVWGLIKRAGLLAGPPAREQSSTGGPSVHARRATGGKAGETPP